MYFMTLMTLLFVALLPQISQASISKNFPFTDDDGTKISTLPQLNAWLKANYTGGDVSIYILAGTYTGSVSWDFQATSGTLKISGKDPANLPVFDGCQKTCLQGESGGFFMRLQDTKKVMSNIILQKIKVKNYVNGILIANTSKVTVSEMVFENIGTAFNANIPLNSKGVASWGGYSALMTDISTAIKVDNNTFSNCYNKDNPLWFHAVYFKATTNSYITNNDINMISGDPIRLRNECVNIAVKTNTLQNSGMGQVTTFEDVGLECPSNGIKASSNVYGMMFPYKTIFSQPGFTAGWAKKAYINEGMAMGQGYKVTVDPALSPKTCKYRNVADKWDVFTSSLNSFLLPAVDSRIVAKSSGVTLTGTGAKAYVSLAKDADLVMDTNMFFVGCNSDASSTCVDNGTTDISDDKDPFNEDNGKKKYLVRVNLKMGTAAQKIQFTGGAYSAYAISIAPPAKYDANGFALVELPVSLVVDRRSEAILHIKALGAGLKISNVQLIEAN